MFGVGARYTRTALYVFRSKNNIVSSLVGVHRFRCVAPNRDALFPLCLPSRLLLPHTDKQRLLCDSLNRVARNDFIILRLSRRAAAVNEHTITGGRLIMDSALKDCTTASIDAVDLSCRTKLSTWDLDPYRSTGCLRRCTHRIRSVADEWNCYRFARQ